MLLHLCCGKLRVCLSARSLACLFVCLFVCVATKRDDRFDKLKRVYYIRREPVEVECGFYLCGLAAVASISLSDSLMAQNDDTEREKERGI